MKTKQIKPFASQSKVQNPEKNESNENPDLDLNVDKI